jgi:hypothetical protein
VRKALRWCGFGAGFGLLALFSVLFPPIAIIFWLLHDVLHLNSPRWAQWVGVLFVAAVFLQSFLGWLLWRAWKKNEHASQTAMAKQQANAIRAMQAPSYWGKTDTTPMTKDAVSLPGFTPGEIVTLARYIARKQVKQEIQKRGLKMREIEAKDISKIADALLAARRHALVEEAKALATKIRTKPC